MSRQIFASHRLRLKTHHLKGLDQMHRTQIAETCVAKDAYENLTVGQNLDGKIANLRKELARLENSKLTLGPLLDMNINDLRNAMSY